MFSRSSFILIILLAFGCSSKKAREESQQIVDMETLNRCTQDSECGVYYDVCGGVTGVLKSLAPQSAQAYWDKNKKQTVYEEAADGCMAHYFVAHNQVLNPVAKCLQHKCAVQSAK